MSDPVRMRGAGPADAEAVAALHADSWRRHYRGAYADAFLDGDVDDDRRAVWTTRLADPAPGDRTVVAERGGALVGFGHLVLDDDPAWGSLVDNLHVTAAVTRGGLGTGLLTRLGSLVAREASAPGVYLWVLEQNVDAQAFYRARGATCVGTRPVSSPGGVAGRLVGAPVALRMAWTAPLS